MHAAESKLWPFLGRRSQDGRKVVTRPFDVMKTKKEAWARLHIIAT